MLSSEVICTQLVDSEITVLQSIYPESHIIVHPTRPAHLPSNGNIKGTRPADSEHLDILNQGNDSSHDQTGGKWLTIIVDIAFDTPKTVVCRGYRPASSVSSSDQGKEGSSIRESSNVESNSTTNGSVSLETTVLPSLELTFHLPSFYPLEECPELVEIHTHGLGDNESNTEDRSSCYLPSLAVRGIRHHLLSSWIESGEINAREGILWGFTDWLASGEFVYDGETGLMGDDGIITITTAHPLTPVFISELIVTHSAHSRDEAFCTTTFSCGICLETKKGKGCVEMKTCGCVFCYDCLRSCWSLAIREGTLSNVACPSFDCTKARVKREQLRAGAPMAGSQPAEEEAIDRIDDDLLLKVVGDVLVERFKRLKEKNRVENDPTYATCPMPHCQAPVAPPPRPLLKEKSEHRPSNNVFRLSSGPVTQPDETELELQRRTDIDRWDRFRQCEKCNFCFCAICEVGWHGAHLPCNFTATVDLILRYMKLEEGSMERLAMEQRYGRTKLRQMALKYEEDESNRQWMESQTQPCPNCHSRVEKSYGCNHITCFRCQCHFCFRCGQKLSASNPYDHYNKYPSSRCYHMLFAADDLLRYAQEGEAAAIAGEAVIPAEFGAEDVEVEGIEFVGFDGWPFR